MRVLLAEDSKIVTTQAHLLLASMELVVDIAETVEDIEEMTKSDVFDLMIFTSSIRDVEISQLVERYRIAGGVKPVIALTQSYSIDSLVDILECGADDCLKIPFNKEEFKARVRAALRRYSTHKSRDVVIGPLKWNSFSNIFYLDDQLLDITPKEKSILEVFVNNPNIIITKELIADKVYSFNNYTDIKTVAFHIHGIRKKITHKSIAIETVKNQGYRLVITA